MNFNKCANTPKPKNTPVGNVLIPPNCILLTDKFR